MERTFFAFLLCCLFLLPACREQSKEQMLQQGVEFANAGNQQAAITFFKDALEKDPNYMEARLQLGLAYFEMAKYDFAEKELEKVQRQDPSNRAVSVRLARVYLNTNRPDKALSLLSRLELASPADFDVVVTVAQGLAMKSDYAASEEKFRKALALQPRDMDASMGLAQVYFATNRFDSGTQLLKSIIADNPTKTGPYYLQFRLALQQADRSTAITALQRIREIDAHDLNAAYLLGMFYLDSGDIEAGRQVAVAIQALKPDHPAALRIEGLADYQQGKYEQALLGLQKSTAKMQDLAGNYFCGLIYYQLKQYEQAISSFQKALDLAPHHEQSRLMLAQTFLRQGRIDDCIRAVQSTLTKNPRSAMAHNMLGSAYLAQGKYDQAMLHLDKALEIDPNLAQAHVKKGLFNLAAGNIKKGEAELEDAVTAAPDLLNNRLLLANYYLRVRNYPQALKVMQGGLDGSQDSAILYNNMAAAYFAQNKPAEAVASLEKARKLKPDYLSPYLNLANYHVGRNDYPAAIKEYQQALQVMPNSVIANLKLAALYELTNDLQQAENYYKKAGSGSEATGYLGYAAYLSRTGQQDKCIKILRDGCTAHPNDPGLAKALGAALQASGQSEEAMKLFVRLEEISPGSGTPMMVAVHLSNGNIAAANEIASRVIAERPDSEYGYLVQLLVHEHQKEWPAAEEILKRGIAACKQDLALKMKLSGIYSGLGKTQQALQIYDEILLAQPKFVPAIFAKAAIFDAQGDKSKAQELYKSALSLDENFAPALNNLAFLQMESFGNHKEALQLAVRAFRNSPESPEVIDTLGYALLKNGQADRAIVFLEKAARLRPNDTTIKEHLEQASKAAGKRIS